MYTINLTFSSFSFRYNSSGNILNSIKNIKKLPQQFCIFLIFEKPLGIKIETIIQCTKSLIATTVKLELKQLIVEQVKEKIYQKNNHTVFYSLLSFYQLHNRARCTM